MRSYGGLLQPSRSKITLLKSTFNADNFIYRLSWSILNGFSAIQSLNVHCSLKSQKITKKPYFWVSRSFKVIDVGTTRKLVSSACYDTQQVCVYLQPFLRVYHYWLIYRWANSGKITISKGGTPLWCPRSRGIPSPSRTKLPHKKLETPGYHMVKTRSLYLTSPWICTGSRQTDGQTESL